MATNLTRTRISSVITVAVPVADPARAVDFYVGTLGFEKRRDMTMGEGRFWIEVAPSGGTTTIALAPLAGTARVGDTGIRLATADCTADHRELKARGADVDDILSWPGVPPMFTLRDPDGNTLYIVERPAA